MTTKADVLVMINPGDELVDQFGWTWTVLGDDPDHTGLPFVRQREPFVAMRKCDAEAELFDQSTLRSTESDAVLEYRSVPLSNGRYL